ncbi:MAG: hypothetical protein ACLQOZ_04245 [Acidimicrobiales bacterium]
MTATRRRAVGSLGGSGLRVGAVLAGAGAAGAPGADFVAGIVA